MLVKDYYSRTDSAKLLDITINQFKYLVAQAGLEPKIRVGCKHSNVLYSREQLHQLSIIKTSKDYKISLDDTQKILNIAQENNYSKTIWFITFDDIIRQPIVCTNDELIKVTEEIKNLKTAITIKPVFQPIA